MKTINEREPVRVLSEFDLTLLRAFLHRETKDFPVTKINAKEVQWIEHRVRGILEILRKEQPFDFVHIVSLTNCGQMNRKLVLSPVDSAWDYRKGIITINLCPCGNDSCWGGLEKLGV